MGNVITLRPSMNVAEGLRNIADDIAAGNLPDDGATVIIGTEVFHLGCVDDGKAAGDAIFNMTFGIHKLMHAVIAE